MVDTRKYVKENGFFRMDEFLKRELERSKNSEIRIAITGRCGTDKPSFINTIRGLKDDDDGAAMVGVFEVEYRHPVNPNISFVVLPGIGTSNYPDLNTYCERIDLEKYDVFLILTSSRFTRNYRDLARKVKSIGKPFFLIRTIFEMDGMSEEQRRPIIEAQFLEKVREDLVDEVERLISSEQEIFLISNHHTHKWDFVRLINAISDLLPVTDVHNVLIHQGPFSTSRTAAGLTPTQSNNFS